MNVTVRELPPNCAAEVETKFEPLTVRVKAPVPALPVAGEKDEIVGTGFSTVRDELALPPPGDAFVTVI